MGFALDGSAVNYYERMGVSAALGLDGNDYTLNLRTLLTEARGLIAIRDPRKIYYGAVHT